MSRIKTFGRRTTKSSDCQEFLDKDTENEILNIFKELAHKENKCVINVTHYTTFCHQVDEVYELQKLK